MVVRKFLDLSTGHLTEETCDDLNGYDGVKAYNTGYGWLLWVPDDPDSHSVDTGGAVPFDVLAVQRYARARDCDYVLFDRDADRVDGLPHWDW